MTLRSFLEGAVMVFGLAGVIAAAYLAWNQGHIRALRETVSAYKELTEGLEKKVASLEGGIAERDRRIERLETQRDGISAGFLEAAVAFVAAARAHGICRRAETCPEYDEITFDFDG